MEGQCYHCLNLVDCRFISRDCHNFDFVGNTHIESQSVLSLSFEVGIRFLVKLVHSGDYGNNIHNHKFEFCCCF